MPNPAQHKVAISYAWKEERGGEHASAVETFCEQLRTAGVTVIRDIDRLKHGECISTFMRSIGASDFLCVFLSDAYLKSPNCMYELLVAWQRSKDNPDEFRSRVKVWVMPGAEGIRQPESRLAYLDHWLAEKERVEPLIRKYAGQGLGGAELDAFRRIQEIGHHINDILFFFADTLSPQSAEEFQKWIQEQFRGASSEDGENQSGSPRDPKNEYARTVATVNNLLRQHPEVARFLREHASDVFESVPPDVQLKGHVGWQRINLIAAVDGVTDGLREMRSNPEFARNLESIIGGLVILCVDPDWVAAQRSLAVEEEVKYSGDDMHKTEGEESVYFLELILGALGDSCCKFPDLFRPSPAQDFNDVPPPAHVREGVLQKDNATSLKRLFIKHIKQRDPKPEDVDTLFAEVRESMSDARKRARKPFCATAAEWRGYVSQIKKDLLLHDLFLIFPSGGSESLMVEQAHLLVPRLHELFRELSRVKGTV